ncbi:hemolysin III family protein [Devosia rhodophyticola]|uniref:Hemolysin III family protein n=1 Tax=Devosia rhodophyticola TaxID=3026423 RepID=A0ABY7YWQ1_9HYPH|nr:hemolysin III family protein [Devosia rhodophyticola]WDR05518.1 hemolysin III family protein [Devosia rhodophyticola]
MTEKSAKNPQYSWWSRVQRPLTPAELIADGIVHIIGLVLALGVGTFLISSVLTNAGSQDFPAVVLYVTSLIAVLSVSMAYNLWPVSPIKMHLARLDQAAIFLFIAGTYTPFLAVLGGTPLGVLMTTFVWGASLIGIALKLFVPQRFGRLAIALYLAIGWSGIFVFQSLSATLPAATMGLLLAGGIVYSLGIIFHLWERLKFQNALWHVFVVIGASLHLLAILDFMVLNRP